jgi:uncharacterized membrane protein
MTGHAAVDDLGRMTNTPNTTNTTATSTPSSSDGGASTPYNVIAVTFESDADAYGALTKLKELDSQGQMDVQEAVVVQRGTDGALAVKARVGTTELAGTAGGGLVGLLVGILGGPVGVLLGGSTGLLIGSLFDLDDAERIESTLGRISQSVQPERNAVLAVVTEPSPEVIDAAMAAFGGTVIRRGVYEVEAEVAAIEAAERKAAREAEQELQRSQREHDRAAVRDKVEQLKAKLRRPDTATQSSAPVEAA